MNIPTHLKYTKSHEWVKLEEDGTATIGITHHAQELLGDMVFVEIPKVGRQLQQGEVISINPELEAAPEKINQDAYSAWLYKLKPSSSADLNDLLDSTGYQKLLESEAH